MFLREQFAKYFVNYKWYGLGVIKYIQYEPVFNLIILYTWLLFGNKGANGKKCKTGYCYQGRQSDNQ